jgi:hypothetical protein
MLARMRRANGLVLLVLTTLGCGTTGVSVPATSPAPRAKSEASPRDGQVTTTAKLGKNRELGLRFARGELELELRSEPSTEERRMSFSVRVPTLGSCEMQVMVDGRALALEPPSQRTDPKGGQILSIKLDYEDLYAIARASQAAVRACGREARFEPNDLALVREFARRLIEELARNGTSNPDDTLDDMAEGLEPLGPNAEDTR